MTSSSTPDEPRRVSPDAPPPDTTLGLQDPAQDNPEQLGADGDTHSGTGTAPYESAYVIEDDDLGHESAGRGADGDSGALQEQKEQDQKEQDQKEQSGP